MDEKTLLGIIFIFILPIFIYFFFFQFNSVVAVIFLSEQKEKKEIYFSKKYLFLSVNKRFDREQNRIE